jgi:hypothetical protein
MALKASYLTIILFIVLALGVGAYFFIPEKSQPQTPTNTTPTTNQPSGKLMSIESYVTQNISTISPEKEVLGGTFYVTEIEASDGSGIVKYEDGHNAFVADFTYTASDREGIDITSFIVRK